MNTTNQTMRLFNVRLPLALHARLVRMAKRERRTVSSVVRALLITALMRDGG